MPSAARMAIGLASVLSCSQSVTQEGAGPVRRDCVQPIAPHCSHLVIVTQREPISDSDALPEQATLFVEASGVYAFEYPALLQRYEITGLPPRVHATSNALLTPTPSVTQFATDGERLFGADLRYDTNGNRTVQVQSWNASNALIRDVTFPISAAYGSAAFSVFQGVMMLRLDALTIIDDSGAIVRTLPEPALQSPWLGSFGCGFLTVGGDYTKGALTTVPLDGRPALTQTSPLLVDVYSGGANAWPYDPHGVLFVTQPISTDPNFDPSAGCTTNIDLLFDDGRTPIHHELKTVCGIGPSVLPSSLGAVVALGDSLALLDANANVIGDPLPTGGVTFLPVGNYIAAMSSEWSTDTYTTSYWSTVIGCGQ